MFKQCMIICVGLYLFFALSVMGYAQEQTVDADIPLGEIVFSDLETALQHSLKAYLATAQQDIQLCDEDEYCQYLAEEYNSTYFFMHKQCANVLEEDRLFCQQFQGHCSEVPEDFQEICNIYMNGDIEQAKAIGLDQEWPSFEDLIVDIALAKSYFDTRPETCFQIVQKYLKPSQSQYYACDIIFADHPYAKMAEIIEQRKQAIDFGEDMGGDLIDNQVELDFSDDRDENFSEFEELDELELN